MAGTSNTSLVLTPQGRLRLQPEGDGFAIAPDLADRLTQAFARGSGDGLLQLGAGEVGTALPAVLAYWREFAAGYVTAVCALPDAGERGADLRIPSPSEAECAPMALAAPPMTGA